MRLTHYKLCPFSRAARILLGELGLEPAVDHAIPWALPVHYLAANPSGRLPMLELSDGTLLCGFYALSEYVGDAQQQDLDVAALLADASSQDLPPGYGLAVLPGDIEDRAEVRRLVDWFHAKCDREVTQELVYEKVRTVLDRSITAAPNAAVLRSARNNLRYHLEYIGFLSDQRNWLAGDAFSLADIAAAAHISILDFLGEVPWESAPHVQLWYQKLKSRRSFRPLLEDKVPGITPPAHYALLDF